MSKESHAVQPPIAVPGHTVNMDGIRGSLEMAPSPVHLQHQSKSFPPRLTRTPSVSSQSSLDSAPSRNSVSCIFIFNFTVILSQFFRIKESLTENKIMESILSYIDSVSIFISQILSKYLISRKKIGSKSISVHLQ